MRTPVEDQLRAALAEQAGHTTTSPEAWSRIEARVARRRRARVGRPWVLVPVLAAAALVVVALVAAGAGGDRGGGERRIRAAGLPGRLYLVPTGLDGLQLVNVVVDPPGELEPTPRTTRVFGRRAPDGVTLTASVAVLVTPRLEAWSDGSEPGAGDGGRRVVAWREGTRFVILVSHGIDADEAAAAEASLRAGPADVTPPVLPPRFETIFEHTVAAPPPGGERLIHQSWRSSMGGIDVTIAEQAGVGLDALAWGQPDARVVTVRGTTGLMGAGGTVLTWIERPGVAVTVFGVDLRPAELVAVAESLRPLDEAAWRRLTEGVRADLPPGAAPDVVIAVGDREGQPWEATVRRFTDPGGNDLLCLQVRTAAGEGMECARRGPLRRGTHAQVAQLDGFLGGMVALDVARIRVLLAGGAAVEAEPIGRDAGFPTAYVVVSLPTGTTPETVVALDAAGSELSRAPIPAAAP